MGDFQNSKTVMARKERYCPECGESIRVGQHYSKLAGSWDGDFYTAFMCLPCKFFADRYMDSMQYNSALNWDECAYGIGNIIDEAAEYANYKRPTRHPASEMRSAILPLFGEIDIAEQAHRRRIRSSRLASVRCEDPRPESEVRG